MVKANRSVLSFWKIGVAAAFLLFLLVPLYLYRTQINTQSASDLSKIKNVHAGKSGALLKTADGRLVLLDTIRNGKIRLSGGMYAHVIDGNLIYDDLNGEPVQNEISTPRGRQYHVVLPDGTQAWLNASSSISFPSAFNGDIRNVKIIGEVYFEVAKNPKKPFIVDMPNKMRTEVLGTHFNINCYSDESVVRTTLQEGSIIVENKTAKVYLKPGQQAVASANPIGASIVINANADLDAVLAWKNGVINFNGADIKALMRQLERWYDIDVVFESSTPDIKFFGEINQKEDLSNVLTALRDGGLKFRVENERRIIIEGK